MATPKLAAALRYGLQYQLIGCSVLKMRRWLDERKTRRKGIDPNDPVNPPLRTALWMKELMARHYLQGRYVEGVKKVAWVTSGAPVEFLRALGFYILYPENHAALCGARKRTVEIASAAENAGYSHDLCSYARTDIGSVLSGKTPVGKLPRPDLLLACTNICQTVLYWYRVLAEHFKVPLILIDTPFLYEEAQPHQIEYVKKQLEASIPVAERVAGKTLSFSRLREILARSKEASELWLTILNRARHRPSPITAFDGFIHMAPIVDLRGEEITLRYYRTLLREIDERIDRGMGAIKNEKRRVLWDNLPIWYKLRSLSRKLAQRGVNVVASTYTFAWGDLAPLMNPDQPLESIARTYLHPILNRSAGFKLATMERMVRDFAIDGVILHSDRSCKPYSLGQMDQRDYLVYQLGIPALLLEADHNDPRSYSDEQVDSRLDAFLEMMEIHA